MGFSLKCVVNTENVEINVYSGFNNYMYEWFFRKQVRGVLIQSSRLSMLQK